MDATRKSAIQYLRNAIITGHVLGFLGLPLGYAISYFFQPSGMLDFNTYITCIQDVVRTREVAPTAIIVTLIVTALMSGLGAWLASRARLSVSSILTEEEMQLNVEKGAGSGNIVFGTIKKGEDNLRGSAKRITKMLAIGCVGVLMLLVLIVVLAIVFSGKPT